MVQLFERSNQFMVAFLLGATLPYTAAYPGNPGAPGFKGISGMTTKVK